MFDICTRRRTHVIAIAFGVIFLVGECFSNLALSIEYSAAPSPGSRVLKSITPLECQPNCSCSDVWIVSTRGLPGICAFPDRANFTVERLRECGRWEKSNLPSLLENPNQPIHIFVHGNRYESGDAKSQGLFCSANDSGLSRIVFRANGHFFLAQCSAGNSSERWSCKIQSLLFGRSLSGALAGIHGTPTAGGSDGL